MRKESKSSSVQIRIDYEDLATIGHFVIGTGYRPDSAGKLMSAGTSMFAQLLINNKIAPKFDLQSAIEFLEKLGMFQSLKTNKKAFVEKVEPLKVDIVEKVERLLPPRGYEYNEYLNKERLLGKEPLEYNEWFRKTNKVQACVPEGFQFAESEYSVPSDTDELLSALEQGKPPTVED